MDKQIREAFNTIEAPERLKRKTKATLRKKTFDYGRNMLRLKIHRTRLTACMLAIALVITGTGVWFVPTTSIAMEVNPSIELKVNSLDRVIVVEGKNSDGITLAEELDVAGMTYDDAMQRVLLSHGMEQYLEQDSTITITVVDSNKAHGVEMLSNVLCRAYNIAKEENVIYYNVERETVKGAESAGLCIPRYLAWQEMLRKDPAVTAEDVKQIPKEEIHRMVRIDTIENPCGE